MMQQSHIHTIQQRILLVTCVVLACVLVIQLTFTGSSVEYPTDTTASTAVTAMDTEPAQLQPIEQYNEISTRPLFTPDRQPYVYSQSQPEPKKIPVKQNTPVTKLPDQLLLTAIVISPEQQLAVLQSGKSKSMQRIKLGEAIDGWTLDEIHNQFIVLKNGVHTHTLELEVKGSANSARSTQVTKTTDELQSQATMSKSKEN